MSKTTSPQRFPEGMDHYYDPNFTADISQKMRVPKRIKVGGGGDDDVTASGLAPDKFDMHVPDRILVAGQEQHIGTRAPPRELILENSVMPPDPGLIRVQELMKEHLPKPESKINNTNTNKQETKHISIESSIMSI